MKILTFFSILGMLATMSPDVRAEKEIYFGNMKNGKVLHEKYCTQCHSIEVYTRKNRSVKSYAVLQHRVAMCASQLRIKIDNDQQQDISHYLAKQFYKF